MAKQTENTALLVQSEDGYLSLADVDFKNDILSELNGLGLEFEKIKMPAGGGLMFEVPGEDGELEPIKEFSGIILHHHPVFVRYAGKYSGNNSPPECISYDGVIGHGNPGGECEHCQYNQFGSGDDGKGKACKNCQKLFILREGELFPLVLLLPRGSREGFRKFITNTFSKTKKRCFQYVTRFSLRKATSQDNITFSQTQFARDRFLTEAELPLVAAYAEQIKVYSQNTNHSTHTDALVVDEESGEVIQPLGR
jgi:hypothetical protein